MRTHTRCALVLTVVAVLGVTLAMPAVAAQDITYKGRTSQDRSIRLEVLKRDSGRRLLHGLIVFATLTCEDATISRFGFGFRPHDRLGKDGSFEIHVLDPGVFGLSIDIGGVVRWGSAEGTLEVSAAGLTEDGTDAQFCATGLVDWTADRRDAQPARPLAVPDDVTMLWIDRNGDVGVTEP